MAKAKVKPPKGSVGSAQSHIRARISYLHKASAYLQSATGSTTYPQETAHGDQNTPQQIHGAEHRCDDTLNQAPAIQKDTFQLPQPQPQPQPEPEPQLAH